MIISAIDYSMNGPAICVFDTQKEFKFKNCSFYYLTDTKKYANIFLDNIHGELFKPYDEECERYDTISDWVMRIIVGSDRVALEGYAYAATGRVFHIAENCGVLKYRMWMANYEITPIAPTQIKKFATGKGNANKNLMYEKFKADQNIDLCQLFSWKSSEIGSPIGDTVDAFALYRYGLKFIIDNPTTG